MSFEAFPTIYDLTDPATNLAGAHYLAYDGSYVGDGSDCAPVSQHTALAGILPDYIEQNRFLRGAAYALPLMAGLYGFARSARFRNAALWALGSYIAPLPAAYLAAFQMAPRVVGRINVKRRRNRRVR